MYDLSEDCYDTAKGRERKILYARAYARFSRERKKMQQKRGAGVPPSQEEKELSISKFLNTSKNSENLPTRVKIGEKWFVVEKPGRTEDPDESTMNDLSSSDEMTEMDGFEEHTKEVTINDNEEPQEKERYENATLEEVNARLENYRDSMPLDVYKDTIQAYFVDFEPNYEAIYEAMNSKDLQEAFSLLIRKTALMGFDSDFPLIDELGSSNECGIDRRALRLLNQYKTDLGSEKYNKKLNEFLKKEESSYFQVISKIENPNLIVFIKNFLLNKILDRFEEVYGTAAQDSDSDSENEKDEASDDEESEEESEDETSEDDE